MKFQKIFKKKITKIERLYKQLYNYSDPEILHQYRTNLRKLCAYNEVYVARAHKQISTEISKFLKKLLKPTSSLRDLDLFVLEIDTLPCSQECKKYLHNFFDEQREMQKRDLEYRITKDKYKKHLKDLSALAEYKDSFFRSLDKLDMGQIVQSMSKDLYGRLSQAKLGIPLKELHKLRIEFKKFRYASEIYEEAIGKGKQSITDLNDLPVLQDLFGAIQDNCVRIILIEEIKKELSAQDYDALIQYFQEKIKNAKEQLFHR